MCSQAMDEEIRQRERERESMRAEEEMLVRHQEETVRSLEGHADVMCPFDRKCLVDDCKLIHPSGREMDDERMAQMMHWEVRSSARACLSSCLLWMQRWLFLFFCLLYLECVNTTLQAYMSGTDTK